MSTILETTKVSSFKTLSDALKKYYWSRLQKESVVFASPDASKLALRDKLLKPFSDMSHYVYGALNAGLEKNEECKYAGSVLLNSVLRETGRRFTNDLKEANELYLAGMKVAHDIWDCLTTSQVKQQTFDLLSRETVDLLWKEYQNMPVQEVEDT